jgi:hypothetical protein
MNPSFFINSAMYPVLPPGAAQASSTLSPGFGSSKRQAAAVLGSWM